MSIDEYSIPLCFGTGRHRMSKHRAEFCDQCQHYHECKEEELKPKATKASMSQPKLDWALLTVDLRLALEQVAKVMHHGADSYGVRNWAEPNGRGEFKRHLMSARERHLSSHLAGELLDSGSGLAHLAHICATDLILLQLEFEA